MELALSRIASSTLHPSSASRRKDDITIARMPPGALYHALYFPMRFCYN
jgi:hypothetical protein